MRSQPAALHHDAVLGSGGLPMEVLEKHVDWYFDPERKSRRSRAGEGPEH